jgi:hypothetical protein
MPEKGNVKSEEGNVKPEEGNVNYYIVTIILKGTH